MEFAETDTMDATYPAGDASPGRAVRVAQTHKTLLFANDKSSGKTTLASAVVVSLLAAHRPALRHAELREYERHPALSLLFRAEEGFRAVAHRDARNAAAYDAAREVARDPNATPWDDLLYDIGAGGLIVDFGANIFAEICRILDDEPRPIFPDGGARVGAVVPVTTAADSLESGVAAIDAVLGWGPATRVFVVEEEYLGRFAGAPADWHAYRDGLLARESGRVRLLRVERLAVADIGSVVFQRIDRMLPAAQAVLRSESLTGAALLRALRRARAEIAWGERTLAAVRPIADWFAT
jgi:hypothetical protein